MNKSLLIEGWRGINHSYAMVNQYQLLELQKNNLDLYHHDIPFYRKEWNMNGNNCGFGSEAIKQILSIPRLSGDTLPDITYRIGFPYNLMPSKSQNLLVYGTSEYQMIDDQMVLMEGGGVAYKNIPATIITPSKWSKVGFINAGFSDDKVKVIPHGVDLSIFKPIATDLRNQYRGLLGADKNSFVILSVGAMTKNKGIDVLLSAYIQLKSKHPELILVLKDQSNLYGFSANDLIWLYCKERALNPESKEMAAVISGIVFISENLDLNQLNGLYNAADCYVSPYRAEGFNLPPLEAAATGCPIVVTKGGATDDYFEPLFGNQIESTKLFEDGKYFLEPKLESLVEILTLFLNKKVTSINKIAAIALIEKKLSWKAVVESLIQEF